MSGRGHHGKKHAQVAAPGRKVFAALVHKTRETAKIAVLEAVAAHNLPNAAADTVAGIFAPRRLSEKVRCWAALNPSFP